jgi:hypothetical protein
MDIQLNVKYSQGYGFIICCLEVYKNDQLLKLTEGFTLHEVAADLVFSRFLTKLKETTIPELISGVDMLELLGLMQEKLNRMNIIVDIDPYCDIFEYDEKVKGWEVKRK